MGGTEHATLRIAKSSLEHGIQSVVFVPDVNGNDIVREPFNDAGIRTVLYRPVEPSYRRPGAFLKSAWSLRKKLKLENVSLLHCCDLAAAYFTGLSGRLTRIPVVCHVRCMYPELSLRAKSFLLSVDHFVFVSNEVRERFDFKPGRKKGSVIYDGIDVDFSVGSRPHFNIRERYGIPWNAKVIGMVARVAQAKDYETLIKAAERVVNSYKNLRFLIVGDNSGHELYREHFAYVKKLIKDLELESYFIFTDYQPDVNPFIDAMDIFVLSTHTEGLPLVILEAMAKGKPIVATAVGGIPEIVTQGETGFLHPHLDHSAFASQILTLLQDESLLKKLGENGRLTVATRWNMQQFGSNMAGFYDSVLKGALSSACGG